MFLFLWFMLSVLAHSKRLGGVDQPMTLVLLGDTTGGTYLGPVLDGKPHGEGTFMVGEGQFDGGKIVGTFAGGALTGQAKGYGKDGKLIYKGSWANGVPHGRGISYFPESTIIKYEGELKLGKSHGQGKSYGHDGTLLYDGAWEAGIRHGVGKMHRDTSNPHAPVYEGKFVNGMQVEMQTSH
eukprot:CAMPEP_0171743244 /NCGR_PEP_ID=MMETSP0991-20121206/36769_1 /TAXON_ID=483369 /ORGANISM="non described non described, Strain CCMP2098" /LENGTH=181 /DNA_ID=CAMNT_0012342127 /DNA_START=23 /DNA_END=568 /DNA_ORIENTATION=-